MLLENDEIKTREGDEIICDTGLLSRKALFYTLGAPIADELSLAVPVTMLLPHIKCQANISSVSLTHITHILENLSLCSARKEADAEKRRKTHQGSALSQGGATIAKRGAGGL